MKKQLSILACAIVTCIGLTVATSQAQEPKRNSGTSYPIAEEVPAAINPRYVRKQMINDQMVMSVMRQQASGEYAARPTVRFPNYHTYQPSLSRVYVTYPYGWYHTSR